MFAWGSPAPESRWQARARFRRRHKVPRHWVAASTTPAPLARHTGTGFASQIRYLAGEIVTFFAVTGSLSCPLELCIRTSAC